MATSFADFQENLRIKKNCQKAARYILESKGKTLEEVIQGYLEGNFDDVKTPRVLEFARRMNSSLTRCVCQDPDKDFEKIQMEIKQKALGENIPIGSGRRGGSGLLTMQLLNTDGLEREDLIRKCFRLIDISMESCLDEPFFRKEGQSAEPQLSEEEKIILQLWQQKYLSCDLTNS